MMKKILVGIDGSARGARALHWAARRASREGAYLELLSVVDSRKVKEAGASIEDVQEAVEANLDKARNFVLAAMTAIVIFGGSKRISRK